MWLYKSYVGLMCISYDTKLGCYVLVINGARYGLYASAIAAADDVYLHTTYCFEWDELDYDIFNAPSSLYEWKNIKII